MAASAAASGFALNVLGDGKNSQKCCWEKVHFTLSFTSPETEKCFFFLHMKSLPGKFKRKNGAAPA